MQDMSMEMSIDHQDFMDIDDNDLMQVDEDARIDAVTDCSRQDSEGTITDWSQQDSKGNIPDWSRQYSKGNITDCSSLESEGTMTDCRSEQELTIEDQSRSKLNNSVWKDQCNSDYTHSLTDEEWNHVGHCEQPAANVKHIVWDENQFDSDDEYKLCDGKGKFNSEIIMQTNWGLKKVCNNHANKREWEDQKESKFHVDSHQNRRYRQDMKGLDSDDDQQDDEDFINESDEELDQDDCKKEDSVDMTECLLLLSNTTNLETRRQK
jgi:hypothetical protein